MKRRVSFSRRKMKGSSTSLRGRSTGESTVGSLPMAARRFVMRTHKTEPGNTFMPDIYWLIAAQWRFLEAMDTAR